MKLILKITKKQAVAIMNAIPKGCSITLKGKDALRLLEAHRKK